MVEPVLNNDRIRARVSDTNRQSKRHGVDIAGRVSPDRVKARLPLIISCWSLISSRGQFNGFRARIIRISRMLFECAPPPPLPPI